MERYGDQFTKLSFSLDPDTLKTMAIALVDFAELNCYSALQLLLEVSK